MPVPAPLRLLQRQRKEHYRRRRQQQQQRRRAAHLRLCGLAGDLAVRDLPPVDEVLDDLAVVLGVVDCRGGAASLESEWRVLDKGEANPRHIACHSAGQGFRVPDIEQVNPGPTSEQQAGRRDKARSQPASQPAQPAASLGSGRRPRPGARPGSPPSFSVTAEKSAKRLRSWLRGPCSRSFIMCAGITICLRIMSAKPSIAPSGSSLQGGQGRAGAAAAGQG